MLELPLPFGSFKTMLFLSALFIGVLITHLNAIIHMDKSDIGILLDGHLIVELRDRVELDQCARRCSGLTHCLSFNFAYAERICQLNSVTKSQADASQILTNGSYVFFDISTWSPLLFDNCVSKPCNGTELCVPTRKSYICLSTDCKDAPPSTVNGVPIQPGSYSIGTIRKYVCPSWQMTIGNNQITCPGYNWSPIPLFTCEYVRSCADLKKCSADYRDGEYWLYPSPYGTTPVKIFCSSMTTPAPKEYITVDPHRNYVHNGHSDKRIFAEVGFNKIATMSVDRMDKEFTLQSGGTYYLQDLGYGRPFNCMGAAPSFFKINTTTTGLILDPKLQWAFYSSGTDAFIDGFYRSADGECIHAACVGSCVYCNAKGYMILHLNPNYVVAASEATMPVCP